MAAQIYQWQPWNSSFSDFLQYDGPWEQLDHAATEVIELNMAAQTYQWQPWNSSFSNFLQEYSLGSNHAATLVASLSSR